MSSTFSVVLMLVASIALVTGVRLFTKSVTLLAHKLRISTYTISFFLVAVGTSLPEAVVSISSGIDKNPILSYGAAMGSNIALVTLVLAIPVLIGGAIATRSVLSSKDLYFTFGFALLPLFLSLDGTLGRIDGVLLLAAYILYARASLKRSAGIEKFFDAVEQVDTLKQILAFLTSLVILIISSQVIVHSAVSLSASLGLELAFIGLTITAVGTSLPEIAFSLSVLKYGVKDEILGDIIGSVIANSTMVLGLAATIYPIDITQSKIGIPTLFFLVFSIMVFMRFARTREKIDKVEAFLLLMIYAGFVLTETFIATHKLWVF